MPPNPPPLGAEPSYPSKPEYQPHRNPSSEALEVDLGPGGLHNWQHGGPSVTAPHPAAHEPRDGPSSPESEMDSPTRRRRRRHRPRAGPRWRRPFFTGNSSFSIALALGDQGPWRRIRYYYREYLAELLGTYVMVLLGLGVIFTSALNADAKYQAWVLISLAWALAIMTGLFISQGVSGGHLNPAVTLAFAVWRKFPWRKVPGYWFAQLLGAFTAAGTLHLLFLQSLNAYSGSRRDVTGPYATAGLFVTFPIDIINIGTAFLSESLSTAILVIVVFGVTDRHNVPPVGWGPLALGLTVAGLLMSLAFQAGGALNPARDLGPRLYLLAAGYGVETFQAHSHYFYVPVVAPCVGAVIGGFVYDLLIISSLRKVI
ncbi:glycerol channel [Tieghemiomyces parasiticus]|uniref:Glycerol channel n=1 Tax=Tieghemiomyces parasiticus TaxID=78921 RepID=A0A9W8DHJ4_9FUNG|nr:glycerol channel [Tieghemiomyces parasiticus]